MVKVVSLFSGCGGLDLGARGGFVFLGRRFPVNPVQIVKAIDFDRDVAAVYAENLGPIDVADVRTVTDWPNADLVIGGPPCQPFSLASKHQIGASDERNCIPAFVDVVSKIRPRAFLMENVVGLIWVKRHRAYFDQVLEQLADFGYSVEWRQLNAADYGVPQVRERVFVQGVRGAKSTGPWWPEQTHAEKPEGKLKPWVTVRHAIADLEAAYHKDRIGHLPEGGLRYPRYKSSNRRMFADRPFFTIKCDQTVKLGSVFHPWFNRSLTLTELKRACSFPDDFVIQKRGKALGNAVPPVLAWHLVRAIARGLGQ